MLKKHSSLFNKEPRIASIEEHSINLTDNDPIVTKPYPIPFKQRERLREEMKKMEEQGIIRKSNSPYASPVVIVQKKDSELRICPDYRKINKVTVHDPEPMVAAEDLLTKIKGSKIFSKLDLCKGYWQVPMREKDISKTGFVTQDGHYEFLRMPFGLCNSGATLVRSLRKILSGVPNVAVYMDDILIFSEEWSDHLETIDEVFRRLDNANVTLKPSKCYFGNSSVEFIGYVIKDGRITTSDENTKKIADAQPWRNNNRGDEVTSFYSHFK